MRKLKMKCRDCGATLKETQKVGVVVIYKEGLPFCDVHVCCGAGCLERHVLGTLLSNGAIEQHNVKYKTYPSIYLSNLLTEISMEFWNATRK